MPRHRLHRMAEAPSESEALTQALGFLTETSESVRIGGDRFAALGALHRAMHILEELRRNAAEGIHRNPPLVVYGNPPLRGVRRTRMSGERIDVNLVGQLSVDVHEIWYTHVKDGKDYHHPFDEGSATMWAARHGEARVLYLEGSQPLWGDFKR